MTRILIRCDASLSIGSGHVIRCRTLARALQKRDAEVLFLCRRQPGDLIALLEQEFRVLTLPKQVLSCCDGLEGRNLYEAWLGCHQVQDAEDCLIALSAEGIHSADWMVVDHYGLDATWESQVQRKLDDESVCKVLAIDDLADRPHKAELLLDQNFFGAETDQRYQDLVPTNCRQLLGPQYALLGPEYAQLQPLLPERTHLNRILVFFGGVDSANLTSLALEALTHKDLEHLAVDVVMGRQSPHWKAVLELATRRPRTNLHSPLPSLAGLITRADLAIGAGGATTWERACLKLPSLVVTIAANQRAFAESLAEAGHLELLGDATTVSAEKIRSAVIARITDTVRSGHGGGGNLTDGHGTSRLTLAMMGPNEQIILRSAHEGDKALLMHLCNDLQVRANNISAKQIETSRQTCSPSEAGLIANQVRFIATLKDGCPVGQICFEPQLTKAEGSNEEAIVDLSLDRCCSDESGLQNDLLRLGLEAMEESWPQINKALTDTLQTKKTSQSCFIRIRNSQRSLSDIQLTDFNSESLSLPPSRITLISDKSSWLNAYIAELIQCLWKRGHSIRWIHDPAHLAKGDVCFLLSCSRLLNPDQLTFHSHNLVVHESDLPNGQGWSPMTWQILEGARDIPVTLFEATEQLDAGPIYLKQKIKLSGEELVEEWRALQAQITVKLCLAWLDRYREIIATAQPQEGETTYYRRRQPIDSQLDPQRSLAEQFDLLRVVDNQKYPAYFRWRDYSFVIKIFKSK